MPSTSPDPGSHASPDPADRSSDPALQLAELEDRIVQTSASISASTGLLLDAVRAFDAAEGWGAAGCRSCAQWLSWRVGLGLVAAREQVRVARALGGLPRTNAALHSGRISYSKVRAMTRVATAANEAELVELAELSTASQLERICRGYRQATVDESTPEPQRRLNWRWEDGGLRLSGWFPAEEGELIRQALLAAVDSLREEARAESIDASAEARSAEPNDSAEACGAEAQPHFGFADALIALAETGLAEGLSPRGGGERTQVVLHLGPDRCCIDDGPPLDLHAALRMSCDAQLLPLAVDGGGRVLDVGRARRSIPSAIGRALRVRDRGCRFPGCPCSRFVDAHHIVHWAHGGETKLNNLVLMCRFHHRLVHDGGYEVRIGGDGAVEFVGPDRRLLPASPPPPAVVELSAPAARLPQPGHVGPWDLGWAVHGPLLDDGLVA